MPNENLPRLRDALAGRYAVERELGAGGMATVYLARDVKHDRPVALKVLRPELSAALGAERFHAEIKVTARLTHPHILALYDSGEAAGMLYYVMPYVEGESLRDRLSREKRLPVDDALRIARSVSDALAYAHAHEVVHRDIKPENIMLQNGHALVADFGIARAVGAAGADRLTVTGLLLGTPLYMSPEQASGEVVIDGRSDVYSLACVLFEMLTGEAPFTGPTMQAVISKRFTQTAPSAMEKRSDIPEPIDTALKRALMRDPGERVASASKFTEMLAAAMMAAQAVASGAKSVAPDETPCIAVLPFTNMSADQEAEFFSDGITEEILNALAKLSGLRVIARTSSFTFKGKAADVREIGKALGAGHILEGSVRKSGNKLRITAQLIEARTGHHLWSEKYDRDMNDIFAVQDEVTAAIRDELSKHLFGIGQVVTLATQPIDAETYEVFLRGRHLLDQRVEGMRQGIQLLKQVVERAPAYAPGHAMLSAAFGILGFYCVLPPKEAFGLARESAKRALALDSSASRAHVMAGHCALFLDWDWRAAEKHYSRAEAEGGADFWAMGAGSFRLASIGQHDAAVARAHRAIETDPLNPSAHTHCAVILILARRFDQAIARCDQCIEIAPDYSEAHRHRGIALMHLARLNEAHVVLQRAVELSRRHPWSVMNLIEIEGRLGHHAEARALVAELRERSAREHIPAFLEFYEARIGDQPVERAFAALDRMIEAREFWLVMLRADAGFDWVRDDPRFEGVCRRVGIPPFGT